MPFQAEITGIDVLKVAMAGAYLMDEYEAYFVDQHDDLIGAVDTVHFNDLCDRIVGLLGSE